MTKRNIRDLSTEQIENWLVAEMEAFIEELAITREVPVLLISFQPSTGEFASRLSNLAPPPEAMGQVLVSLAERFNQAVAAQARN